jgi:hypothetical protein
VDLDEIYREMSSIDEQQYTNTARLYWHGSTEKELRSIKAHALYGETVPLAWVSNSFDYAARFALSEYVYNVRQTKSLNIWNPRADKDWNALVKNYPEFKTENSRKLLTDFDWLSAFVRAGKMRLFQRNDLLEAIKSLNYDGVFNKEDYSGSPALGVFENSARFLNVIDAYTLEKYTKLWRSIAYPSRAYNPKTKKFLSVRESEDRDSFMEDENGRQNFLEGSI